MEDVIKTLERLKKKLKETQDFHRSRPMDKAEKKNDVILTEDIEALTHAISILKRIEVGRIYQILTTTSLKMTRDIDQAIVTELKGE